MIHFESDEEAEAGARRALNSWTDAIEALANGESDHTHWSPSHRAVVDGVDLLQRELTDQHALTFVLLAISDGAMPKPNGDGRNQGV